MSGCPHCDALAETLKALKGAAANASATAVTAIERIQEMEKVVEAAEAWVRGGSHSNLTEAVKAWQTLKQRWS